MCRLIAVDMELLTEFVLLTSCHINMEVLTELACSHPSL